MKYKWSVEPNWDELIEFLQGLPPEVSIYVRTPIEGIMELREDHLSHYPTGNDYFPYGQLVIGYTDEEAIDE